MHLGEKMKSALIWALVGLAVLVASFRHSPSSANALDVVTAAMALHPDHGEGRINHDQPSLGAICDVVDLETEFGIDTGLLCQLGDKDAPYVVEPYGSVITMMSIHDLAYGSQFISIWGTHNTFVSTDGLGEFEWSEEPDSSVLNFNEEDDPSLQPCWDVNDSFESIHCLVTIEGFPTTVLKYAMYEGHFHTSADIGNDIWISAWVDQDLEKAGFRYIYAGVEESSPTLDFDELMLDNGSLELEST